MTQERLIWRPNTVAPDVWEAMSREAQVAWWKAEPNGPPRPKRRMTEAIAQYKRGIVTASDFVCRVYELAAPDEIGEFLAACPADLLSVLQESLANYG
jgi:hypothetical protein